MKSHPFLEELKKRGIVQGLERVYDALVEIGSPHLRQRGALVAGTNGKGSTSYILYRLLHSHGFSTALYTSPHIKEVNDRYIIDNVQISDERLGYYIENLKYLAVRYNLTLFEFETIIAFQYFSDMKVDYAIFEVGMGGRLDATNCYNPEIKIITSISRDHTEYLGNTEEEILYEKAGIIRPNNTVITGIDKSNLLSLTEDYCKKQNAKLLILQRDFAIQNTREEDFYEIFDYRYRDYFLRDIRLSLFGRHQVTNCSLSLTSFLKIMDSDGHKPDPEIICNVLKNIRFSGRFEIYSKKPLIVIDGAHNSDGVKKLRDSLLAFNRQNKRVITIFSSLKNKKPEEKINILKDITNRFLFVENDHPLSLKNDDFIILARKTNLMYFETMDIETAIQKVFGEYRDDLILITGSLYTLPEIYMKLEKYRDYGEQ